MRAALFSFVKISDNSMVASVRIARYVASSLNLQIYDDAHVADTPLDVLVIVGGAFAFCNCREALGKAVFDARRVIWIQNDYTIIIPGSVGTAETPFRKAFRDRELTGKPRADMWTTCEKESRYTADSMRINWNSLTLTDISADEIRRRRDKSIDYLFYYGSYRSGREDVFDRFFMHPTVHTYISCPTNKFASRYKQAVDVHGLAAPPYIRHQGKIEGDLYARLGEAGLGLCCEDKRSHKENHSPPNRFYEMLSAGLPMVFQQEMAPSLRKNGYDPEPFVARSAASLPKMMKVREEIGDAQRTLWLNKARAERDEVDVRMRAAWGKLMGALR